MSRKAVSPVLGGSGRIAKFFLLHPGLRVVAFGVVAVVSVGIALPKLGSATLDTPQILSYQARLTDAQKVTVPDGAQLMSFLIWDSLAGGSCVYAANGTCGTPGTTSVTVTDGLFNVLIGDTAAGMNAFSDSLFNTATPRYLEIIISGETLTPRRRIVSSANALQAGNASLLDSFDTSQVGGAAAFVPVTDSSGNLVLTSNYYAGDGSFAFPAYSFVSDPDTGVTSGGSNSVALVSGSGNMLTVSSSGVIGSAANSSFQSTNVGGNVTLAAENFDGTNAASNAILFAHTFPGGGDAYLTLDIEAITNWQIGAIRSTNKLQFGRGAALTGFGDGVYMTIDSSGNVGIGTTSPLYKFHVVAGSNPSVAAAFIHGDDNGLTTGSLSTSGSTFAFEVVSGATSTGSGAIDRFVVMGDGDVGIGTTSPAARFSVGATSQFQVNSVGNLSKINNIDYNWPGAQGAANSILQNDGTGVLSWSTTGAGVVTLQNAYTNSTVEPEITLDATRNDITIQNAVGDTSPNFLLFRNGAGTQVARISSAGSFISGSGTTTYADGTLTSTAATYTINAAGTVDIQDILNADSLTSEAGVSIAAGNAYTGAGAVTLSSGAGTALTVTGNAASSWSTTAGNITLQAGSGTVSLGTSTSLAASGALSVSSGGAGALSFDSASDTIVIAASDTALQRTAAGTFTIDLNDGGATTLSLVNSGAGIASISLAEAGAYTGSAAVTLSSGAGAALTVTGNAASTWGTTAGNLSLSVGGAGTAHVQIGTGAGTTTPDLLVTDVKTDAGDPTGTNGAMYYNSNTGKFRCFEAATWKDCDTTGGTTSLQSAYNNGATITTSGATDIAFTLTSGNFTVSGAGSVDLTPTAASSFTSGGALTFTGGAASTWGTTTGNLSLVVGGSGTAHVHIGDGAGSATPDLLVVDSKSTGGDPAGTDGAVYYNASSGLFRIFESGLWKTLCNKTDQACGAGTGSALSAITAAVSGNSIDNGDNAQAWNWALTSAAKTAFTFGETTAAINGVGNQALVDITTLATSTAAPLRVTSGGTANGLIDLTSTGDFVIQDAGTSFVQFLDNGTVTVGKSAADSIINLGVGSGVDTIHIADGTGADVVTIGQASADVSITDAQWSISSGGTGTFTAVTGTGALTVSSGGAGALTLDSASNTLVIAATDTTLQRTAAGTYTINLTDGANTTLSLNNSGAGIASMSLAEAGSYTGAGAVTVSSGVASALTITGNAASTWSTSAGALTVDSAAALNLGTTSATSVSLGRTGITTTNNGALTVTQTFTANGIVALGDGGDTVTVNSSDWDISSTGDMTNIGAVTMDGAFSQTGATTFSTGTGAISLNGDTTIAAGKNLIMASGAGTFTQTFTGTTTTAHTITANSLTTGSALVLTATSTPTAGGTVNINSITLTDAATTVGPTTTGLNLSFADQSTIAHTQNAMSITNAAVGSFADTTVESLLLLDQADTTSVGTTPVTSALKVTSSGTSGITNGIEVAGANVTNGLNLSGTFGTSLITSTKFSVAAADGDTTFTDDQGSITFSAADSTNAPMIQLFASGTSNGDRMVLAHSSAFTNFGLQYQDVGEKFNFLSAGSAVLTADLGTSRVGVGTSSPTALLSVGASSQFTVDTTGSMTTSGNVTLNGNTFTSNSDSDFVFGILENITISKTFTTSAGENEFVLNFNSPAYPSGTNIANGFEIVPTIGNATGGTNTANLINIENVTGDAQIALRALSVGNLTGTAASEIALNIGSGWDSVLTVNGTSIINGSGVTQVAGGGTGTSTSFTTGSVVFAGASGVYSQDNSSLFWDDTNNRLGIGTTTPGTGTSTGTVKLELSAADAWMRIHNTNDTVGAWVGNSFGAGAVGMYNPSGGASNNLSAAEVRMALAWESAAVGSKVGSVTNDFVNPPAYRNLLDDGTGGATFNPTATTGSGVAIVADSLTTTGMGLDVSSASVSMSTTSARLVNIDHTATYTVTSTLAGRAFEVDRSITLGTAGQTLTHSATLARFVDSPVRTNGTFLHSSDIMQVGYSPSGTITTSGTVLNITGTGGKDIFRANDDGSFVDASAFIVNSSGQVQIGSIPTSGTERLCWDAAGASLIQDCTGTPGDYAEEYGTTDASIGAGDIVMIDAANPAVEIVADGMPASKAFVIKSSSPYSNALIGVVSTSPNEVIGTNYDPSENPRPIAIAGRIPVKVNLENGAINPGDPITSSSTAGVGMRSTKPGMILGYAQNSWSGPGQGTVLIAIGTEYYVGATLMTDGTLTYFGDSTVWKSKGTATVGTQGVDSESISMRGSGWDGAAAQDVDFTFKNVVTNSNTAKLALYNDAGSEVMSVNQAGDLSISGKLYPSDRGTAQTSKYIYYDSSGPSDYMRTNAAGWGTGSYDFAELFPSDDMTLVPGELVAFDPLRPEHVVRARGESATLLMGIVSTRPGFLAGEWTPGKFPIALAGRVPTKVSVEKGPIHIGDPLTISPTVPGVAVKATDGNIVGYALENADFNGTIVVYVKSAYITPKATASEQPSQTFNGLDVYGILNIHDNMLVGVTKIMGSAGKWEINADGMLIQHVATPNGTKDVYASASPQATILLFGHASLQNGTAMIVLDSVDPGFTSIINPDAPMFITVTPTTSGSNGLYVKAKTTQGFVVADRLEAPLATEFDWTLVAYRKGYAPVTAAAVPVTAPETTPPSAPPTTPVVPAETTTPTAAAETTVPTAPAETTTPTTPAEIIEPTAPVPAETTIPTAPAETTTPAGPTEIIEPTVPAPAETTTPTAPAETASPSSADPTPVPIPDPAPAPEPPPAPPVEEAPPLITEPAPLGE